MNRISILTATLVAAAVAATGTASAATPTLKGFVDDSFKIGVKLNGKTVTTLKPGKYLLVVADTTSSHNFHITGPGLNKSTSVGGKATAKWTITLKKGTYKYVCDPHASFMHGQFSVR